MVAYWVAQKDAQKVLMAGKMADRLVVEKGHCLAVEKVDLSAELMVDLMDS
jgi:hypothetical protein